MRRTLQQPSRITKLRSAHDVARLVRRLALRPPSESRTALWRETGARGIETRGYGSYDGYVEHQRSKLEQIGLAGSDLTSYDEAFKEALLGRLRASDRDHAGRVVLCLGARTGAEVRAFLDLGAFAVGVDLNPGPANKYVLVGDFHDLQFPANSVDCVYTNSLDHAFDLARVGEEVGRVLRPSGTFLVEAALGTAEGYRPGDWEATAWRTTDDVVSIIEATGYRLRSRQSFDTPWKGTLLDFSLG